MLREVAFHGLAGDYVRLIEPHTEADPAAVLVQFLVMFGNVIGRHAHFCVEADRHYLNLFAVLVGDTAKGRKGVSGGQAKKPFSQVDPGWLDERIVDGLSSGEGLIYAVRNPISKNEPVRSGERSTGNDHTVIVDPGVVDKRLLVMEGEFASVLKVMRREGSTLSAVIRKAWDDGILQTLTKNSPTIATGAHISIIGHITKDELLRCLDSTEAGNGFGNRFLWCAVRRSKLLPEGGQSHQLDYEPLASRLTAAVEHAQAAGMLVRDDEARSVWAGVYQELSEGKPGLLGSMIARAEAQTMRLACLFALLDCSAVVTARHLLAALDVWDYCEASARWIFGDALGNHLADKILTELRLRSDGMTRTEIRSLVGRRVPVASIDRALRLLAEQNLATSENEDTGGRSAERWRAVTPDGDEHLK